MKNFPVSRILLISLSANLLSSGVIADTVYKSVDKAGKVTYSSSPIDNLQPAIKVDILPPPSEAAVNAAQERHQQNLRADKIFNENAQQRSQQITEDNRIKHEKRKQFEASKKQGEVKEKGPYYGIPGHGILVLPAGPRIHHK